MNELEKRSTWDFKLQFSKILVGKCTTPLQSRKFMYVHYVQKYPGYITD